MLWQRFTAPRALTVAPLECRHAPGGRGAAGRRAAVPVIVREPESGWWESQARLSVTVAAVHEGDADRHPETMVGRMAAVASDEQLVVIIGAGARTVHHTVIAGLRHRLPRRQVVTMLVRYRPGEVSRDAARLERQLDAGRLPVVVTPTSALHDMTAEIASYLRADRVLRVVRTADGAELHPVWERPGPRLQPVLG